MTWLASELNKRIQIEIAVNTPNTEGGYTREYSPLVTAWAKVTLIAKSVTSLETRQQNIRNQQVILKPTHEFKVRADVLRGLGKLNPTKTEYFIRMDKGYQYAKRFRIMSASDPDEKNETILIQTRLEVDEGGCFA